MYTDIDSPELEEAIARAQEDQEHIDKIEELLAKASPAEKIAIAVLALADIKSLPADPKRYVTALVTYRCPKLVLEARRHIRHIGESNKGAIALEILSEQFAPDDDDFSPDPNEDNDDEEDDGDEEDESDEALSAALAAGDLAKAFRLAAALDDQRDFAAFRAEAISSH